MVKRLTASLMAMMFVVCLLAAAPPTVCAAAPRGGSSRAAQESFYLKDGDRVVFYGDSITDQRLYTTYIETYCRSRFPKMRLTFVHSGWGGDRVSGGGGGPIDLRLRRDVLPYKPTVVTICLGMNDGGYRAFDAGLFDQYVRGYEHILDTLTRELPGVRITLLTASAFDDVTRPVNFPGGYNATLVAYGEAVKDLGRRYNLTVADTNAPLVAMLAKAQARDPQLAAHILNDRVHPGPGGHLVMAAALLQAWHAPAIVAEIALDAGSQEVTAQRNTRISDLKVTPGGVTFTHADNALPWPLDRDPQKNPDMILALASTDITANLNQDTLQVTGLSAANYTLKVDGTEIGTLTRDDLQKGVDLTALPAWPANIQAQEVLKLTKEHNNLHYQRWRQVQVPAAKDSLTVPPEVQKQIDALDAQEAEVLKTLQAAEQPKPHRVELVAAR